MTSAGIQVAAAAKQLSQSNEDVNQKLISDKTIPSGKLRVYATNAFGSLWLAPRMGSFLDKYPDISLALSLRDAEPKVSPSQPPAEIRMTPIKTQDYIQIKLATLQYKIMQPFDLTSNTGKYDLSVNVYGGGTTGQAEAIRLAVSRALCELSEDNKSALKSVGLLTRDPRMVERKKFGQKKARKKFQFSKR